MHDYFFKFPSRNWVIAKVFVGRWRELRNYKGSIRDLEVSGSKSGGPILRMCREEQANWP